MTTRWSASTAERNQSLPARSRHPGSRSLPRRHFLQLLGAGALGAALSRRSVFAAAAAEGKALRGLFPIGSTPFTPDNLVDFEDLAAEARFCVRGGVHGFVWPQIASRWDTLTEAERLTGAETILDAGQGGRTALVIGVQRTEPELAAVERLARHAAQHGADAIISLPPRGVTDGRALLEYYSTVGRMTDLPLFVQSEGDLSIDLLVEMFRTIPTMRVVKDEAGVPLERVAEIRARTNNRLEVFSGQGVRTMISEMQEGFTGHCPYTGLADLYAQAYDLFHGGNKREAFDMFGRIAALQSMGIQGGNDVLIARGVFKPTVTVRPRPGQDSSGGGGGNRRRGPEIDTQGIRDALQTYLAPYLKA